MTPSPLKTRVQSCSEGPFKKSDFSIGHRGAALQFPEHTRESYEAGARMGAGILECDVTFTSDKSSCAGIRSATCTPRPTSSPTPLAAKCSVPFTPAQFDAEWRCSSSRPLPRAAPATLPWPSSKPCAARWMRPIPVPVGGRIPGRHREFPHRFVRRPEQRYLADAKESIELFKKLGVKMTPEAQVAERADAVRRPHPGGLRPEDDR